MRMGWGGSRGDPPALSLGFSLSEFFPWLTRYIFFLGITQFNHSPTATMQLVSGRCVKSGVGTSLEVQWLGLGASTAGARVQSLVGELRSRMPKKKKKKRVGLEVGRTSATAIGGFKR